MRATRSCSPPRSPSSSCSTRTGLGCGPRSRAGGQRQEPDRGRDGAPTRPRGLADALRVLQPAAGDGDAAGDRGTRRTAGSSARRDDVPSAVRGAGQRAGVLPPRRSRSRTPGGTRRCRRRSTRRSMPTDEPVSTRSWSTRARTSAGLARDARRAVVRTRNGRVLGVPRSRAGARRDDEVAGLHLGAPLELFEDYRSPVPVSGLAARFYRARRADRARGGGPGARHPRGGAGRRNG